MVDFLVRFASELASVLYEGSLYMLIGFVIAGLLAELVPTGLIARHLGGDNLRSVLLAALFGAPIPLCSCGVLPAAAGLRRSGASRSATLSFLISTPETGVDSIALSYGLLGPVMAVVRPLVAILSGMVAGLASIGLRDDAPDDLAIGRALERIGEHTHADGEACPEHVGLPQPGTRAGRARRVLRYAFVTLVDDLGFWMLVGLVITGIIAAAIPDDFFTTVLGWDRGLLPMVAMAAIGVPLYLCASASTPVAAALIAKGLSPGAALVFLLCGPGASAVSVAIVGRLLGRRHLRIYLSSIVLVSIAAGLALDTFGGETVRATVLAAGERPDSPLFAAVKAAAAAVFVVTLGASLVRTGFRDGLRDLRARTRSLADEPSGLSLRDILSGPTLVAAMIIVALATAPNVALVVEPGQRGVVREFGKIKDASLEPGVHFHLPPPFGRGDAVDVDLVREVTVGFRGDAKGRRAGIDETAFYLTADENILDVRSVLHYRVRDAGAFLSSAGEVEPALGAATRGVLVDLIAGRPIDALYTTERRETEHAAAARLRATVDKMDIGVEIVGIRLLDVHAPGEVHDAFRDVASSIEDKDREVRDADGYAAEQAAAASGLAAEMGEQASATALATRSGAEGSAAVFTEIARVERAAPFVTDLRLYLETVERALAKARKLVGGARANSGDIDIWLGSPPAPGTPATPAPELPAAPLPEEDDPHG